MKRSMAIVAAISLIAGMNQVSLAAAKGNATSGKASDRIAVVNLEKVYREAPQIKRGNEEGKKKFGGRDEQFKSRLSRFQKSAEEFKRNAPTLSEAEKNRRDKELTKEQEELNKMLVELQRDRSEFQNFVLKGFQNDLNRAVTSIAEEKKLDMVLTSGALLYKNDSSIKDVTQEVLGKLK